MTAILPALVMLAQAPAPLPASVSPLQALVDRADTGATIEIPPGVYTGDLTIDRSVRVIGRGRPRLVGSGAGTVIRVQADDVVLQGLDIDGRGGGDLARDPSGIHVAGRRVTVRDCRITQSLFGVYLREADDALVERVDVSGIPGRDPGEQGSGIHVWNTTRFRLLDNTIRYSRDGLYLQSSTHGRVAGNAVSDVRYGLHYMFSDDNVFEDNRFERNAAGAALMYSQRLVFRRNQFLRNRGYTSVGLLLKSCDDVVAEDNVMVDNARGLFVEGSSRNQFRRNLFAKSDIALVLYDSSHQNRFDENDFVGNLSPMQLVGRRTDTVFDRNYFSDADCVDFEGDGLCDRPYRLSSVFDHLRGNVAAADLFTASVAAAALSAAERALPVLDPVPVLDLHPAARPQALLSRPVPAAAARAPSSVPLAGAVAMLGAGAAVLWAGRRRFRVSP